MYTFITPFVISRVHLENEPACVFGGQATISRRLEDLPQKELKDLPREELQTYPFRNPL